MYPQFSAISVAGSIPGSSTRKGPQTRGLCVEGYEWVRADGTVPLGPADNLFRGAPGLAVTASRIEEQALEAQAKPRTAALRHNPTAQQRPPERHPPVDDQ